MKNRHPKSMPLIKEIYTDGACLKNPGGPGGWAAIVFWLDNDTAFEMGGHEASTTSNRMELGGAIAALEFILKYPQKQKVMICSDSKYVINGVVWWSQNWKINGWVNSEGNPVKNRDLWVRIHELLDRIPQKVGWKWVRGHDGNPGNEHADAIACAFARQEEIALQQQLPNGTFDFSFDRPCVTLCG